MGPNLGIQGAGCAWAPNESPLLMKDTLDPRGSGRNPTLRLSCEAGRLSLIQLPQHSDALGIFIPSNWFESRQSMRQCPLGHSWNPAGLLNCSTLESEKRKGSHTLPIIQPPLGLHRAAHQSGGPRGLHNGTGHTSWDARGSLPKHTHTCELNNEPLTKTIYKSGLCPKACSGADSIPMLPLKSSSCVQIWPQTQTSCVTICLFLHL